MFSIYIIAYFYISSFKNLFQKEATSSIDKKEVWRLKRSLRVYSELVRGQFKIKTLKSLHDGLVKGGNKGNVNFALNI